MEHRLEKGPLSSSQRPALNSGTLRILFEFLIQRKVLFDHDLKGSDHHFKIFSKNQDCFCEFALSLKTPQFLYDELRGLEQASLFNFYCKDVRFGADLLLLLAHGESWSENYLDWTRGLLQWMFLKRTKLQKVRLPASLQSPFGGRPHRLMHLHCFDASLNFYEGIPPQVESEFRISAPGQVWSFDPVRETLLLAPEKGFVVGGSLYHLNPSIPAELKINEDSIQISFWSSWTSDGPWDSLVSILPALGPRARRLFLSSYLSLIPPQILNLNGSWQNEELLDFLQAFNQALRLKTQELLHPERNQEISVDRP